MGEFAADMVWAFGLGVFTSITPCPLATNIAAVSYIGRSLGSARRVFLTGLLYALGRTLAYLALGVLLVAGLMASERVSSLLREHMNEVLGPLLILVAVFLLEMLQFSLPGAGLGGKVQGWVDAAGAWGALPLGALFALSICPVSAGLFFFMLIPHAAHLGSSVALPSLYGIGTALPVVAFAAVLAFSAQSLGKAFQRVAQVEWWMRSVAGAIFLALGVYFTLVHIYDLRFHWGDGGLAIGLKLWL